MHKNRHLRSAFIIIIILFGKEITIVTSQGTEAGRQPLERRGQEKLT